MNKLLKAFIIFIGMFILDFFISVNAHPELPMPITWLFVLEIYEGILNNRIFSALNFPINITIYSWLVIILHNWWLERKGKKNEK